MLLNKTLTVTLTLLLTACGGSTGADSTSAPKKDQAVDAKAGDAKSAAAGPKDAPAQPGDSGYQSHLLAALGDLAAGGPITKAETKAYGCSVKYAEGGGEPTAKLGEPAPAFSLPDTDGKPVSLADFAGKTVVLEWFNPYCPFVKYAHGSDGPLAKLANEQQSGGVVWLAINSGASGKQGAGAERSAQAKSEWQLEHPILIDEDGAVGRAYGAQTTPHMFVIDGGGKLVYAGALDNAPLGRVGG